MHKKGVHMLELKNIHWKTPENEEIVKGIDLSIPEGKLTVITGPNGGGKTSLAKLIAGLYTPSRFYIIRKTSPPFPSPNVRGRELPTLFSSLSALRGSLSVIFWSFLRKIPFRRTSFAPC